jgi:hydroxyacyl-ACP dehydratase HTD2-like protein with hotdog domain
MGDNKQIQVGDVIEPRPFVATAVSLFTYNAAIWNPHRIHYDERYTTDVEHHPGVVVDGPLQGDWLTQVATEFAGDQGQLRSFEYSNRKAAYLGETLYSGGDVVAVDRDASTVTLNIYIKNQAGDVISPATAVVEFR